MMSMVAEAPEGEKLVAIPTDSSGSNTAGSPAHSRRSTGSNEMSSSPGELVVTEAMQREEAALHSATEASDAAEAKKGVEEFEHINAQQRFARLNLLLDRSSIYADFLFQRMKEQEETAKAKEQRAAKKQQKQQEAAAAAATTTTTASASTTVPKTSTRHGGKGDTESASAAAPAAASPAAAAAGGKRASARPKPTEAQQPLLKAFVQSEDFQKKRMKVDPEDKSGSQTSGSQQDTYSQVVANGEHASDRQPSLITGGVLRDYQLAGVEWMKALYENGLNGILADEMGLKKTVQVISFLAHLYGMRVPGPFLVVGPLSTLSNWVREFRRFAPQIPVMLYHGSPQERAELRPKIGQKDDKLNNCMTVVTSYEIIINDRRFLQKYAWKYIVVDEGHRIKNLNCRLIQELKQYQSANRLLLTGTPLQNNLSELWSLLNFLLPDIFDDLSSFQRWFDIGLVGGSDDEKAIVEKEEGDKIITKLHQILKPFLLRRLKTDVEYAIPPKKDIALYAPLTEAQQTLYTSIKDRTLLAEAAEKDKPVLLSGPGRRQSVGKKDYRELSDREYFDKLDQEEGGVIVVDDESSTQTSSSSPSDDGESQPKSLQNIKMMNVLMQLRKVCNHPYLLEYPLTKSGDFKIDEKIVSSSGKMQLLDRLLPRLRDGGHKVLIFSQMTTMLDILQDYCWLRGFKWVRLDGNVSYADREEAMNSFNDDPEVFIFLLSTRAGGLGINLIAADTVILYDSDWNPQADLQAQDRCHRIGQTKPVMIYRLVVANTVDQMIVDRAESKRKLEKLVIHKGRFKGRSAPEAALTAADLLSLLREQESQQVQSQRSQLLTDDELKIVLDHSVTSSPTSTKSKHTAASTTAFRIVDN